MPLSFLLRRLERSSASPSPSADILHRSLQCRRLTKVDTIIHHPEHHEDTMFFTLAGVILAVLSLPFIVIAGERATNRRLPQPAFVRSLSDSMARRRRKKTENEGSTEGNTTAPRPSELRRAATDSTIRNMDQIGRVETGFSASSGETYVRGMSLEKIGLD